MEKVTHISKHFETNVALLRNEVSRYLERGICIIDHGYSAPSVLSGQGLLIPVCREISKARDTPFVLLEYYNSKHAHVRMPMTNRAKPLYAQAMLMGRERTVDNKIGYFSHPIVIEKKAGFNAYYSGSGLELLKTWLHLCETDNAMRFALGLPPKVTR